MSVVNAEKIAKRIEELPPLPLVVQKILAVVSDDRNSAKDVGAVLSIDQALTSKVLKLVNSAFYGLPGKVSTITRAVVILGNAAVRNLALAFSSYDALKKLDGPADQEKFWNHALTTAVGAQVIAAHLRYPEVEEAFIAGLLHDIGHLILSTTFPAEYIEIYKNKHGNLLEKEEETFGTTHTDVGTRLLEHWQIPEQLCRVTRFHHSPKLISPKKEPLISLVVLAEILASVKGCVFAETVDESLLVRITNEAGLSMREYGKILPRIDEKIEDAKLFLSIADYPSFAKHPETGRSEITTVAVLGRDEQRAQWVKALLESFGHHVLLHGCDEEPEPDWESIQLAILDPQGIPEQTLMELGTLLQSNKIPCIVLTYTIEGESVDLTNLAGYPTLPFIFSRDDFEKFLCEEPADVG